MVSELCCGGVILGARNALAGARAQKIDLAMHHGLNFRDTAKTNPTNPVEAESLGGGPQEVIRTNMLAQLSAGCGRGGTTGVLGTVVTRRGVRNGLRARRAWGLLALVLPEVSR
jgi:hypothetical protein